jgi:hypothetical protein
MDAEVGPHPSKDNLVSSHWGYLRAGEILPLFENLRTAPATRRLRAMNADAASVMGKRTLSDRREHSTTFKRHERGIDMDWFLCNVTLAAVPVSLASGLRTGSVIRLTGPASAGRADRTGK